MAKDTKARILAASLGLAYTAPIPALIHLCDREPDRTDEALARIEAFSRHFIKTYGEGAA